MDSFLVYMICFGVGLLFSFMSWLIGDVLGGHDFHFFGGHDVHTDVGTGGHAEAGFQNAGMPGFSPFSPTVLASFVTAFGGLGMIFSKIQATRNPWVSAPLAVLGGLVIAAGVFLLFRQIFSKTQSSSESHVSTLI